MNKKKSVLDTTLLAIAVIGSLIAINVVSVGLFGRLDLTRDKEFTLSVGTKTTLNSLSKPVTVRAYFTKDLPPPYATNTRYVRDLLDEYYNQGDGNFRYEFIDPTAEETSEDKEKKKNVQTDIFGRAVREKTSVEIELEQAGVPPVQVRVNEDDKLEVKRAYMGIVINYEGKKEVIPVVQQTDGLEYNLTTLIRKITREAPPKIALAAGLQGQDLNEKMAQVSGMLAQLYDVVRVDLSDENAEIPNDAVALLVVAPHGSIPDAMVRKIDAHVMAGRSAAFLLDGVDADIQTMRAEPIKTGLSDLLASYGVEMQEGLVLDAQCATISIAQQRGAFRVMQPVQYPYILVTRELNQEHPLTRGLAQVAFPFMSPLKVLEKPGVAAQVLVKSSDKSWYENPPYNLDPLQRWTPTLNPSQVGTPVVVALTGALAGPSGDGAQATNGRVLVASGAGFVMDQFMSEANQAFVMNMLDWLVLDEALLSMRARGLSQAPLDELSENARTSLKWANIAGLPVFVIGLGLFRWRHRESRRKRVTL